MKGLITGALLLYIISTPTHASGVDGSITFNVGKYPLKTTDTIAPPPQEVTLLSCGPKKEAINIEWNQHGQRFHEEYKSRKKHYHSKYYLASPPCIQ